jgi:hypothetical protein
MSARHRSQLGKILEYGLGQQTFLFQFYLGDLQGLVDELDQRSLANSSDLVYSSG